MVKQSTNEKRHAIRAKRILSIQYRVVKTKVKNADKRWHLSTTHDMSFLGLAFFSDVPLHVDDVLELNVVMSGILDIFKGYGKVVRVEKKVTGAFFLVAIRFVELKKTTPKSRKKTSRTSSVPAKRVKRKSVKS